MTVIKKSGKLQDYNAGKIEISLLNTAQDIGNDLSEKDAHLIALDVTAHLMALRGEDGLTSSWEIRALLEHVLLAEKYQDLAQTIHDAANGMIEKHSHL